MAVRYSLDRRVVAGVIAGVRLGLFRHDQKDHELIQAVMSGTRDLYRLIGACGDEYRH